MWCRRNWLGSSGLRLEAGWCTVVLATWAEVPVVAVVGTWQAELEWAGVLAWGKWMRLFAWLAGVGWFAGFAGWVVGWRDGRSVGGVQWSVSWLAICLL